MANEKKVLITGATGYIGSHTMVEMMRQTNYRLIAVDNFVNSSPQTIDRIRHITGKEVAFYEVDLADQAAVAQFFRQHPDLDGVIHFAALKSVGESVEKPHEYYRNNLNSLNNLLHYCALHGVRHFIFSSSCSVYGNVAQLPVTEQTPLSPAESPYAHTKKIGEEMMEQFTRYNDLQAIALRYFNPVGADHTGLLGEDQRNKPNNLVPVITLTAAGILPKMTVFGGDYDTRDGSCIRDYVHVSDIADAHLKAMQYLLKGGMEGKPRYDVLNLGTGSGVTVLEAIRAFEKVSGVKLNYEIGPRRAGDVVSIYSNCEKAERLLGWNCRYGIEDMMRSAWQWQLELAKSSATAS